MLLPCGGPDDPTHLTLFADNTHHWQKFAPALLAGCVHQSNCMSGCICDGSMHVNFTNVYALPCRLHVTVIQCIVYNPVTYCCDPDTYTRLAGEMQNLAQKILPCSNHCQIETVTLKLMPRYSHSVAAEKITPCSCRDTLVPCGC